MSERQLVDRYPDTVSEEVKERVRKNESGIDRRRLTVLECVYQYQYEDFPFYRVMYEVTGGGNDLSTAPQAPRVSKTTDKGGRAPLEESGFYERLNGLSEKLYKGINGFFAEYGIPGHVKGIGSRFGMFFGIENDEDDYDFRKIVDKFDAMTYREFIKEVLNQGLYFHIEGWSSGGVSLPTHSGITAAHTEEDISITLEKIQQTFKKLSKRRI